jgi:hypothetical protein
LPQNEYEKPKGHINITELLNNGLVGREFTVKEKYHFRKHIELKKAKERQITVCRTNLY